MLNNSKTQNGVIVEIPMCILDSENACGEVVNDITISVAVLFENSVPGIEKATALLYSKLIQWVMPMDSEITQVQSADQLKTFLDSTGFEWVRSDSDTKFFRQFQENDDEEYESEFLEDGAFCGFSFPRITNSLSAKAIDLYTDSEAIKGSVAPYAVIDATGDHTALIPVALLADAKELLPVVLGDWNK
ncbi:hypothetical protein [Acinetobacter sp. YH12153]|uniref:hypothetical protein n=1 Tax=Acinetobacter sp. YH12153 TaxID=2601133 RepID=UPI0015D1618B|nr:hypothetical protein [Acinetobacter sp. YH12153]